MRILHVVPSYLPAVRYGGPIFAVHGLCRALAARGHEVQVFTTNIDGAALYRVPEIVTLGRLPGEGESDSRWRTKEVRHVGSDTLTPGF
jgi:hypothetical protein